MIAYSRRRYPTATFAQGDLRDLSAFAEASYDAVVAAYNVIDVLGESARSEILDGIFRLPPPGGLVVVSSHNRAIADRLGDPLRLRGRPPREIFWDAVSLPRWLRNRRRLVAFERTEPGYAILNDAAHDFSALHYYITRDAQQAQLRHAPSSSSVLDLGGRTAAREISESPELHFVARRVG